LDRFHACRPIGFSPFDSLTRLKVVWLKSASKTTRGFSERSSSSSSRRGRIKKSVIIKRANAPYLCVYTHTHTRARTHTHTHTHTRTYIHTYVSVCVCVRMCVCVYKMYASMYMYMRSYLLRLRWRRHTLQADLHARASRASLAIDASELRDRSCPSRSGKD